MLDLRPLYAGGFAVSQCLSITGRRLSFGGLRFHGLGCGKFPIPVWLGAQGAGMQFASFLGCCTTSWARHGQYLLAGEFFGLHET